MTHMYVHMSVISFVQKVENGDFNWIVPGEREIHMYIHVHVHVLAHTLYLACRQYGITSHNTVS